MIQDDEWLRAYFAETGREIDNASAQLHETTNWSIGVVIAAVTAIAVSDDPYPTRWTLAAVVVAWVLTLRFFVRSCIAYSYLARRNKIHRKIVEIQRCEDDAKKSVLQEQLKQAIDLYDVQWKSATPLGRLLWSNLKLGYIQLFLFTLALMAFGFINSDWNDWVTRVLLAVPILDTFFEVLIFPGCSYLEFKPIRSNSSENANEKMM